MKCRKASAVIAKPSGTFTPLLASSRTISPSEAFLPPTSGKSSIVMSANHLMKGWDVGKFIWKQLGWIFGKVGWEGQELQHWIGEGHYSHHHASPK